MRAERTIVLVYEAHGLIAAPRTAVSMALTNAHKHVPCHRCSYALPTMR